MDLRDMLDEVAHQFRDVEVEIVDEKIIDGKVVKERKMVKQSTSFDSLTFKKLYFNPGLPLPLHNNEVISVNSFTTWN
jgi:hypothetical protein